ncbi:UNVERIFIED_CONTAM: hypothetical protein H355_008030 [Colinus virginianus]|nr:hypothetical protein H355_008030 [Colinus virginianus]
MAAHAEDYLESLLIDAFKGKGYQKISDLLQEKETDSLQKYSNSLLSQLDKALRRILSSLLAVTLQTLFIGKKQLVNLFLPELGRLVTETSVCCALRQENIWSRGIYLSCAYVCRADYDLQVALSEALCRLTIKKWRDDLVNHWFEDKYLAEAFKEIKDKEFETKIGNDSRGNDTTAMFPQVKKPSDEKLEKFWIDFNTGSHSVTFYIDSTEGVLWDSVRLQKEAVSCYSLKEDGGEKIVKIYMKIPATLNRTEATKIKLCFSAEYEILSVLKKVLGDEKMMQKKSNSDVTMTTVNQQSELDEVDQGSEGWYLGKENQNKRFGQAEDWRQYFSVSLGDCTCQSASDVYTLFCLAGRTPMTLRFQTLQVMRRKHLFSESNNEKTSKSESEKSWILNSQKETLPKSLNYTRKRRRVRRKLKGEVPSEEPKDTWQPLDVSMEEHSDVEEEATQEFHKVSAEETKEESFKRKDSDTLSGTIVKKPRFFSSETKHLSPESPLKPKKLLDSFEKEDEIVRGLPAPNGVSCGQSRYKEMEMTAQNTLKTSEKNVSALLKEIHRCRLNKLESFKKIVVEELASLEKDTQILRDMEKDAVDFWNAQLHKLNSFCNQQKRRIQSVDSALGETAESFASTIVNTTHNLATKSPVENGVFIVPSD